MNSWRIQYFTVVLFPNSLTEMAVWSLPTVGDVTIGVGAQSTLGGHKIFPWKICIKNQQNVRILHDSCLKNYQNTQIFMIYARKIYKIPKFYMTFARQMSEFYIIIAWKIFFPNFRGHVPPCSPVSYAYGCHVSLTAYQTYETEKNVSPLREGLCILWKCLISTIKCFN